MHGGQISQLRSANFAFNDCSVTYLFWVIISNVFFRSSLLALLVLGSWDFSRLDFWVCVCFLSSPVQLSVRLWLRHISNKVVKHPSTHPSNLTGTRPADTSITVLPVRTGKTPPFNVPCYHFAFKPPDVQRYVHLFTVECIRDCVQIQFNPAGTCLLFVLKCFWILAFCFTSKLLKN